MSDRSLEALRILRDSLDIDPNEREQYVSRRCGEDVDLREQVQAMLRGIDETVDENPAPDAAAGAGSADALLGTRLGPFRVIERIGRGGMGVVYRGERGGADFAQTVAIKLIRRGFDFDDVQARFLRERRILARLNHPNLARFIDGGVAPDGRPWFALEFVEGDAITRWCDARRLDVSERVRLFLDVCAAVQYAHSQLVVHRDLKPANILVGGDGNVRLLDFGIARLLEGGGDAPATLTLIGSGYALTPEYAAPEQFTHTAAGVASDVYSLGMILYELVTGVLPFVLDRNDLAAVRRTVLETPPESPTLAIARSEAGKPATAARLAARRSGLAGYRSTVRGDLARILDKALAKEPQRRYASVQVFADDLSRWLAGAPVQATGNSLGYRAGKFLRRHRLGVTLAALALAGLLIGVAAVLWQARIARQQAESATAMKDFVLELLRQTDSRDDQDRIPVPELLERGGERLRTLPAGSELRLDMLGVLLRLHLDLGAQERGIALAQAELGSEPDWRLASTAVGLKALTAYAHLFDDLGREAERDRLLARLIPAVKACPEKHSLAWAEAAKYVGVMLTGTSDRMDGLALLEQATVAMRELLPASDPRRLGAEVLLGGALTHQRQGERGRELTEHALAAVDDSYPRERAYVQNMAALRRALFGEFESAETLFASTRALLDRQPDRRLQSYYAQTHASNAFDLGDRAHAQAMIERGFARAAALDPEHVSDVLYLLRGELALLEGRFDAAAEDFAQTARMTVNGATPGIDAIYAQILRAVALHRAGRHDEARESWRQADAWLAGNPLTIGHTPALLTAAKALLSADADTLDAAFAQADAQLAHARTLPMSVHWQLRENRDEVRLKLWHAQALLAAGRPQQARDYARQALPASRERLGERHFFVVALQDIAESPAQASPSP